MATIRQYPYGESHRGRLFGTGVAAGAPAGARVTPEASTPDVEVSDEGDE